MPARGGDHHRYGRTNAELEAAVAQGVARLNDYVPGWRNAFTTKRAYNFEDPCKCVLGTIGERFGPYRRRDEAEDTNWDRGKLALDLSPVRPPNMFTLTQAQQHGFDWTDTEEIPILVKLWDKEIGWDSRVRKSADSHPRRAR